MNLAKYKVILAVSLSVVALAGTTYVVYGAFHGGEALVTGQSHNECYGCHDGSIAGASNVISDFEKISHHPYSSGDSTDTCGGCHNSVGTKDPSGTVYAKLLESKNASGEAEYAGNAFCGSCHGADSTRTGGDHVSVFAGTKHDVNTTGTLSGTGIKCVSCHNQHGSNIKPMIRESISGRALTGDNNTVCLSCHTAPLGVFAGEGAFLATPHGSDSDTRNKWPVSSEAGLQVGGPTSGNCTNCHNPHGKADGAGGVIPKYALRSGENLCYGSGLGCHAQANSDKSINIYARFTADADNRTHHNISGADQSATGAVIECTNCHNTHTNNAENKNSDPDAPATNFTNMIDDVTLDGTTVVQPMTEGIDTFVDGRLPYSNSGGKTYMWVGWIGGLTGAPARGLIKYDISRIPPVAVVSGAVLSLPQSRVGANSSALNISLYANLTSFSETSTTYFDAPIFDPAAVATASSSLAYKYLDFNGPALTSLVQSWIDGSVLNNGLTIRAPSVESPSAGNSYREFLTSDQPNRTPPGTSIVERPKLTIYFSAPSSPPKRDFVGFCGKCHDGSPPAGVVFPLSTRQIEPNYSDPFVGDTHGAKSGPRSASNSVSGQVSGPYFFGVGKISCFDCHDPHGSPNAYALRETVNGQSGLKVPLSINSSNYSQVQKFCGACHTAAHAPSANCFSCHFHGANADSNTNTHF